jgi:hypothetical protein
MVPYELGVMRAVSDQSFEGYLKQSKRHILLKYEMYIRNWEAGRVDKEHEELRY